MAMIIWKEKKTKLNQTIDDPFNEGIFHALEEESSKEGSEYHLEWLTQAMSIDLDLEYYYNMSGEKFISPLYEKLKEKEESGKLIRSIEYLAKILLRKYSDKWNRLYKLMVETDYNPLHNYDMEEKEKVATKIEVESQGDSDVYAFNDDNSSPQSKSTSKQVSKGDLEDNVRENHKKGNLGVTTTQAMATSEIRLRAWNFYQSVMADIDEVIVLNLY